MTTKSISVVKLNSGETLIGEVAYADDGSKVTLTNAFIMVPVQKEKDGKPTIMLAPIAAWVLGVNVDAGLRIGEHSIAFVADPDEQLLAYYRSSVSGLALPAPRKLLVE